MVVEVTVLFIFLNHHLTHFFSVSWGFPGSSESKQSACSAGDLGSRLGRSPGEGNGYPLCILAWRVSWTEEPGGLQSMGSQRVTHNWASNTFTFFSVSYICHSTCQSLWAHTSCFSPRNSYWMPVMCQALGIQWLRKRTPWLHRAYMWSAMMMQKMIHKSRLIANRDTVMSFSVDHLLCPRSISYRSCHPILKIRKIGFCSVWGGSISPGSHSQSGAEPPDSKSCLLWTSPSCNFPAEGRNMKWQKKGESFQNKSL